MSLCPSANRSDTVTLDTLRLDSSVGTVVTLLYSRSVSPRKSPRQLATWREYMRSHPSKQNHQPHTTNKGKSRDLELLILFRPVRYSRLQIGTECSLDPFHLGWIQRNSVPGTRMFVFRFWSSCDTFVQSSYCMVAPVLSNRSRKDGFSTP